MKRNKAFNPKKIQNILIVNVHSTENAGDYALLKQTIYYLEEAFDNIHISIMSNWPKEPAIVQLGKCVIESPWWIIKVWDKGKKPRYQVLSLLVGILWMLIFRIDKLNWLSWLIPEDWKDLFLVYKHTDLVVAVSGNQLFSSGRFGWPLLVVGFPIYLARFFKRPTIIFPQSVGPLKTKFDKWYVRFLYNNVKKLYIRDLVSLELIYKLNIDKSKPSFMHDVAFTFPADNCNNLPEGLQPFKISSLPKKLGMTIISNMPSYLPVEIMNSYYLVIAKTIDSLINLHGFSVFLFCQVFGPTEDENDNFGIKRVMEFLPYPEHKNIHIINQNMDPSQLKAGYGLMDLFVASRLHSGIFSLGMGVPTLFIGYLYKTIGLLRAMDLTKYYIDLEDITHQDMTTKIITMWDEKEQIKERIEREIEIINKDLAGFPHKLFTDMMKENEN